MIWQVGHCALIAAVNSGRSLLSYRAVLDSGRSRAIFLPEVPPPPPPPLADPPELVEPPPPQAATEDRASPVASPHPASRVMDDCMTSPPAMGARRVSGLARLKRRTGPEGEGLSALSRPAPSRHHRRGTACRPCLWHPG